MRAFTVLDLFEPNRQRLTLNEISEGIDLPKSTTFRILQTLVDAGYLVQIDSMHYGLSHRILRLGNCVLPNLGAREIAHPELEKINAATQETVALSEFLGTERILIDVIESTHALISGRRASYFWPITRKPRRNTRTSPVSPAPLSTKTSPEFSRKVSPSRSAPALPGPPASPFRCSI